MGLWWLASWVWSAIDIAISYLTTLVLVWKPQMGTWKAGTAVINTGIRHPSSVMKNVIPIVMAGGEEVGSFRKAI